MTREQKREHFRQKDATFEEHRRSGIWPSQSCEQCKVLGHCCVSYGHHIGDNCVHCGNDERRAGRS